MLSVEVDRVNKTEEDGEGGVGGSGLKSGGFMTIKTLDRKVWMHTKGPKSIIYRSSPI